MLRGLLLDLRYAFRSYGKRPGFALAAGLMLALGIGANTAIFSVAYGVLLKPLSYSDPDRLVSLWPETSVNKLITTTVAERAGTFSAVSAYLGREYPLGGGGAPMIVRGGQVSPGHFDVLQATPQLGRTFLPDEGRIGEHQVVVLGDALWRQRFGGDAAVVGRTIELDGQPHTVVGVMGASLVPLEAGWELWTPLPIDPANPQDYFGSFYLSLVGRLRPDVSPQQANAELAAIARELQSVHPNLMTTEKVEGARTAPLHEHLVGRTRPLLLVLLAAVGIVLLIACGNVANLLLARAAGRQREMAVRRALGARAGDVLRQVFTESLLLGVAAGIAGLGVAFVTLRILLAWLPPDMPRMGEVGLNAPVLAFTLLISVVAAVLFGIAPARTSFRVRVHDDLKDAGTGGSINRSSRRSSQALVVAEVAAATVLLIAAGLTIRSLARLQSVDPGFRAEQVLSLRLDLIESQYPEGTRKTEYYQRVLERVGGLPGVTEAGAIHLLPLTPDNWNFPYLAEDNPIAADASPGTKLPDADFRIVTPGYFRTMDVSLIAGRDFTSGDDEGALSVGIINRTMSERLWPGGDALGKSIQLFGQGGPTFTVVGVVEDVHPHRLDASPAATMYRPFAQWPVASMYLAIRTVGPPGGLAPSIGAAIREVDPEVPISRVQPMQDVVRSSLADERFSGFLIVAFALLALILAIIGVYSVISYTLAGRQREIGLRQAVGARPGSIFSLVLREGLVLTSVGLIIGVASGLAISQVLASRLFEAPAIDPLVIVVSALCVMITAVIGCSLPAMRASRVPPLVTLKGD
jgi:putative ABC transport system permease protein